MRRGSQIEKTRRQADLTKFNQAAGFLGVFGYFLNKAAACSFSLSAYPS